MNEIPSTLIKRRTRKKGTGCNISVYYTMDEQDLLDTLYAKAGDQDIRSVSDFIREATIEKYNREFVK